MSGENGNSLAIILAREGRRGNRSVGVRAMVDVQDARLWRRGRGIREMLMRISFTFAPTASVEEPWRRRIGWCTDCTGIKVQHLLLNSCRGTDHQQAHPFEPLKDATHRRAPCTSPTAVPPRQSPPAAPPPPLPGASRPARALRQGSDAPPDRRGPRPVSRPSPSERPVFLAAAPRPPRWSPARYRRGTSSASRRARFTFVPDPPVS